MIILFLKHQWPSTFSFIVCFVIYLLTLCPTVYVEGSGELIGAVHTLGIPHPTGYPLFTLIGRLFSAFLPFDSVAYRVNIASSFLAALSVAALAAFLRGRGCHPWASVGGALAFAFSTTFWSNAVIAEVYGLSLLGAVAMVAFSIRTPVVHDTRGVLLAAYAIGISMTTHLSQVLIIPGIIAVWMWRWNRATVGHVISARLAILFRLSVLSVVVSGLGFSIVCYLVVRSSVDLGFQWGPVDTPELFWNHITGSEYRFAFFSMPTSGILLNVARWSEHLLSNYNPLLCLIACWGIVSCVRCDRSVACVIGITTIINFLMTLNYYRDPNGIGVFFLLSFFGAAVFISYGINDLCRRFNNVVSCKIVYPALSFTVVLSVLGLNISEADRSDVRIAHSYGMDILTTLPNDSILMTEGDDASFIVDYLHRIEGVRPDVTIYMRSGKGTDVLPSSARYLEKRERSRLRRRIEKRIVEQSETGRPVFFLAARSMPAEGFEFVPTGLCYQAKRIGVRPTTGVTFPDTSTVNMEGSIVDPWARIIQGNYWFRRGENHSHRGERDDAIYCFERASTIAYDSRTMRFNTALRLNKIGEYERALRHIQAAIAIDPMLPQVFRLASEILKRAGRESELPALRAQALTWGQGI